MGVPITDKEEPVFTVELTGAELDHISTALQFVIRAWVDTRFGDDDPMWEDVDIHELYRLAEDLENIDIDTPPEDGETEHPTESEVHA